MLVEQRLSMSSSLAHRCRELAVVAAFSAVAKNEDQIGGTVKITAFDDVPGGSGQPTSSAPPPGSCNLVAFPAGPVGGLSAIKRDLSAAMLAS